MDKAGFLSVSKSLLDRFDKDKYNEVYTQLESISGKIAALIGPDLNGDARGTRPDLALQLFAEVFSLWGVAFQKGLGEGILHGYEALKEKDPRFDERRSFVFPMADTIASMGNLSFVEALRGAALGWSDGCFTWDPKGMFTKDEFDAREIDLQNDYKQWRLMRRKKKKPATRRKEL